MPSDPDDSISLRYFDRDWSTLMENTIFRLDFSRGTVEQIDETTPPQALRDSSPGDAPEALPRRAGYVLAALGTPPDDDEAG